MKEQEHNNQIIIYDTEDGQTKVEVLMKEETVWLSQKQVAELFDCSVENIIIHLQNVFLSADYNLKTDYAKRFFASIYYFLVIWPKKSK